ncbi:DUF382-domain-containing protein [Testicularia cyperi]|uniref:DUF382-domain-containing protein n=1 Tax=Testicularia cyperi TaxID=1882483 RepID=A0A317XPQ2_9BASI|nr:DUF382-domain-containing protein [Testicularia cyperi]
MAAADTAAAAQPNGHLPLTKNAKRRLKKKQQHHHQQQPADSATASTSALVPDEDEKDVKPDIPALRDAVAGPSSFVTEAATIQIDPESEAYKAFSNVFSRFQPTLSASDGQGEDAPQKGEVIYSDDDVESDADASDSEDKVTLSKRKQKKLQRLSVAELKQLVRKPEVVEWTDVTANDPRLLVHLKCLRNSVPVPPHWAQKRDYLQNKRGIEKPAYQLPDYIADTGIATMKDALKEKEAESTLKQKTRDRVQPKMGKMDIDYQKLYDAFFKFQSRPKLTAFGDTYYEGKEFETKFKDKRPGHLSDELTEALSIPPLAPPPWLIAMQRYGPPPSYPHLKIPGLNAPIPQGASWGFHPGGWGRPPVDEYGNPLYGDVLGSAAALENNPLADPIQKDPWGELEPEEYESDQEEEEEEEQDEQQGPESGRHEMAADDDHEEMPRDVPIDGLQSVSSLGGGVQTPSFLELRKDVRRGALGDEDSSGPVGETGQRQLYHVLPERQVSATAAASSRFMGSERVYDMSSYSSAPTSGPGPGPGPVSGGPPILGTDRGTKRKADTVNLSINPDQLDLDPNSKTHLAQQYDQLRKSAAANQYNQPEAGDFHEFKSQRDSRSFAPHASRR